MNVQMENRLARSRSDIEHGAIAVLDISLPRDFGRRQVTESDYFSIFDSGFVQSGEVLFRNHQNVGWGLGIDIFEGEDMFVLINLLCWNFTAENATK